MLRGRTGGDRQIEELLLDRSASTRRARLPPLLSAADRDQSTSSAARQDEPRLCKSIGFARVHSAAAAPRERDSPRIAEEAEDNTLLPRSRSGLRVALYVPLLRPRRLSLS